MATNQKGIDYMSKYNKEKEVWKDIVGYEGYYQVSTRGIVRSVDREIFRKDGVKVRLKGAVRKPKVANDGYYNIYLTKDGVSEFFPISRLVATHFIPNPHNKEQVNHIDEDKSNNHISNLEWATAKENANHGTRNERISRFTKKNNGLKPVRMLSKKGSTLKEFESINEAFRYLNRVTGSSITQVCLGKKRSAYGYKWEYINE